MKKIIVTQNFGQRLDVFLSAELNRTRSSIKNLLDDNKIVVNGKKQKAGYIVCLDDENSEDILNLKNSKCAYLECKCNRL